MEEQKMDEKESLRLIQSMVEQSTNDITAGMGNYFLLWGYSSVVASLAASAAVGQTQNELWYHIYALIPFIAILGKYLILNKFVENEGTAVTFAARAVHAIWVVAIGILALFSAKCILHGVYPDVWKGMIMLCILIPSAVSLFTGFLLKEKTINLCGFAGIFMGCYCLEDLITSSVFAQVYSVLFPIAMVAVLIVPGHLLNHKARKEKEGK